MKKGFRWIALILALIMLFSAVTFGASAKGSGNDDELPLVLDGEGGVVLNSVEFDGAENTADGTVISWKAFEGAAKYALYLHDGDEFTLLAVTDQLSYTHTPLTDGSGYLYNIKAMDADDEFISGYAEEDLSNTFRAPVVISSLSGTDKGVAVRWNAVEGTQRYSVFRSSDGSSWNKLADADGVGYSDNSAASGSRYYYNVRALAPDGESYATAFGAGAAIDYVRTPSVTSIENTATGAKVTWNKPKGVSKIRLYYKRGSDWIRICETSGTSYVHDGLKGGTEYVYTVRGVDGSGDFVTDFNRDGWKNTFIVPPVITSLTNTAEGVEIRWKACAGAVNYRIYYYGSRGWTAMAHTTDTVYLDTDVSSGYHYTYTVRCVNADNTAFTSYHNSGKVTQYISVPEISSITNTDGGSKISWKKPAGAQRIRVYYRGSDGWIRLTETTADSYVHNGLSTGRSYTYTLRCVDSDGDFVSDFNAQGWNNTYIKPPVITSFNNTAEGVEIRWGALKGAQKYRVYYYGSRGWTAMVDTADTYYLDTDVASGYNYRYTVRCVSDDGKTFMSYHTSGKTTKYISVPKITSIENTETGAKISWSKPSGAVRFRVYYYNGSGWTRIGETTSTSYVHDKLTHGRSYTYTVRCVDSDGDFVSDFNSDGWKNTFIAPPELPTVSPSDGGYLVKWKAVSGIASYRLYRKPFRGSWGRLSDRIDGTSFLDRTAQANTLYAYTARCLDENGNVVSDYYGSNTYYYNGKLANGTITVGNNKLNFSNGVLRSGYQKIDGKTYYYDSSGVLQKNGIVGSASDGYCYADKNGVIDFTYRNGVTSGGYDWNVLDGKAYKVTSDKDRTLFRALKLVYKVTDRSMSKSEKLRTCFKYLQNAGYTEMNPRIPDYTGMDWPIIYANDIFVDYRGNCLSFAAAFAYMAKAIGYENVYGCNSGGHGWAEIDGLVYDPEWGMHRFKYSYYGMSYSEPCDVAYAAAISAGYAWMHIKI